MVSGRMGFDFPHCFAVINLFVAIGAIVKLQLWNRVGLPLVFSDDVAYHVPNLVTTTGRTSLDLKFIAHGHIAFFDEIRK